MPKIIKGWLWSANQVGIDPTNMTPSGWSYQPWSKTGHNKKPQPDNAEFYLSQATESCLGILNNQYNDSVAWHDIGEFFLLIIILYDIIIEFIFKQRVITKQDSFVKIRQFYWTK